MWIDTQIKSFVIPSGIWADGLSTLDKEKYPGVGRLLPPLQLPARDALAIELRVQRGVNLHNEQQRYTLCNHRIQEIVITLADLADVLSAPVVWPKMMDPRGKVPSSRAYLAVVSVTARWMRKFLLGQFPYAYGRLPAIFFPPQDAKQHYETYRLISQHPEKNQLFARAAKEASIADTPFILSPEECQNAFLFRMELLHVIMTQRLGLVDILEVL